MKTPKNLTGQIFGRLTALLIAPERVISNNKSNGAKWICSCSCGNTITARTSKLMSGRTQSCGCLRSDKSRSKVTKHSRSKSSEYRIWTNIKTRCYNPKGTFFKHYGARGITMCVEWIDSFETFLKDMGERPSPVHTIERIVREQQNNRRNNKHIEYLGSQLTVAEASRITALKQPTFRKRLSLGWSVEDAISKPLRKQKGMI